MSRFKKLSHAVWECKDHVVWCPKYRFRVLRGQIGRSIRLEMTGLRTTLVSGADKLFQGCPSQSHLRQVAHGQRVLNLFSYSSGFSVHTIKGGASSISIYGPKSCRLVLGAYFPGGLFPNPSRRPWWPDPHLSPAYNLHPSDRPGLPRRALSQVHLRPRLSPFLIEPSKRHIFATVCQPVTNDIPVIFYNQQTI